MASTAIRSVSCLQLRLPFNHGAPAPLFAGKPRTTLDSGLIRVELENGTIGWGESYAADLDALSALFLGRIAPLAIGQDALDPLLTGSMERTLHNLGRSGPVLHALSGLDIALWDIRGKLERVPIYELLGGARRTRIPAYASLLQYYGDTGLIDRNVSHALEAGYGAVKLHEKTTEAVAAARAALGQALPLMIDTNCAWQPDEAIQMVSQMAPLKPFWIEEPIWPPEDTGSLRALRQATGIPVAVGENAASTHQLANMISRHDVDYIQPSVVKSGGITSLWRLARLCVDSPVHFAPHSAFFGPGYLATLHMLAAHPKEAFVERLYCTLGFVPYRDAVPLSNGAFELTDRPGLGADPDPELLAGGFVTQAN